MKSCPYKEEDLCAVDSSNVRLLQRFNEGLFPVPYDARFYQTCKCNPLTRLLLDSTGQPLAALCAVSEIHGTCKIVYIRAIGVSVFHREKGIGSLLLKYLEARAREEELHTIQLHVQTSNETAICFYKSRGFRIVEEVKHYYKRIEPPHAFLLEKRLIT